LPAFPEFSCNWFAAYTSSRHEKRVASQLKERHVESFCPLYSARHRWKNRAESDVRLPLFPNYVFVQIEPRERRRVLEVPGVLSLVSFGRKLAALPTREVEALRSSVGQMTIEPHPYLVIGERVRITTGAMVGIEGVLVRKKNHVRVVIALNALMRGVAVEVDECDLEPAGEFRA
jgi:transcription antitermination factor NusG